MHSHFYIIFKRFIKYIIYTKKYFFYNFRLNLILLNISIYIYSHFCNKYKHTNTYFENRFKSNFCIINININNDLFDNITCLLLFNTIILHFNNDNHLLNQFLYNQLIY